ncbi:MAG: WG repeat-containing protein [Pseudomonadota bacterium]
MFSLHNAQFEPRKIAATMGATLLALTLSSGLPAWAAQPAAANSAQPWTALRLPVIGKFGARYALISPQGTLLREPDVLQVVSANQPGQAPLPLPAQGLNGLWGYLSHDGKWVAEPQYVMAKSFSEDTLARVQTKSGWGFIDASMKLVIPAKYKEVEGFREGLAPFTQGSKWGFLAPDGKEVIAPQFDRVWHFASNGLARILLKKKWGFINKKGEQVIPLRYSLALDFGSGGVAAAEENDKWGLINSKGLWLVKPIYGRIDEFNADGVAAFRDNDYNVGFIGSDGKVLIAPHRDLSESMHSGLVKRGGKGDSHVQYVNQTGKVAIEGPFDWGDDFNSSGMAVARQKGKWGLLNKQGKFIASARHIEPTVLSVNSSTGLSSWITTDHAIEWLDRNGKLQFRLEQSVGGKAGEVSLKLSNSAGNVLWQDKSVAGSLDTTPKFETPASDLLHDANDWTNIAAKAQRVLKAKPRPFAPGDNHEKDYDPYVIPEDEDDADNGIFYGAVEELANDYTAEERWGEFYFLQDQRDAQMTVLYDTLQSQLNKAFGPPSKPVKGDMLASGDSERHTTWQVGKQQLILQWTVVYGDGDITHQVLLAAVQELPPKLRKKAGR